MVDANGVLSAVYDPSVQALRVSGEGGGAVDSVNGQAGTVVIGAADVDADPEGTAEATVEAHTLLLASSGDGTHGAVTGTSKICVINSPTGTAQNIFVDEESTPSTGEFVGDVRIVVPDGFF